MSLTLSSMPEEILERVLDLVIVPPSVDSAPRPAWQSRPRTCSIAALAAAHVSVLLVCHAWLRIATPLHYRRVVLASARQAALFAATLRANPELGRWVRAIRIEGTFDALVQVVPLCAQLEEFDMVVDNGAAAPGAPAAGAAAQDAQAVAAANAALDEQVARFCASFELMPHIKHLVVRKNAYLTQARPTLVFEQLGKAVASWKSLETVNIAFRFSPPSLGSGSFAASLAAAPNLRAVRALLPAIWNSTLLEISENPALKGIQLSPDSELIGAHLFLSEARKHARLMDLIHAGTPVMRRRAQTLSARTAPALPPVDAPASAPAPENKEAQAARPVNAVLQRPGPGPRRLSGSRVPLALVLPALAVSAAVLLRVWCAAAR